MTVYTVTKPVGTTENEFEAYTRLLEDVGIDVSNSPRVPESGTGRKWLYAWKKKIEAERFAAELRARTGDTSWFVHQFDIAAEGRGPVAPLDIATVPEPEGYTFYLTPASRERVISAYPGTRLPQGLSITIDKQQHLLRQQGPAWWAEVSRILTGRNDEEIEALGGVRIVTGDGGVAFQKLQPATTG